MNRIVKIISGMSLYDIATRISQNMAYFLPRNVDISDKVLIQ